jgi:hypothetical protein
VAADDRAEHPQKKRCVKELLDHLADILRGLSPDRLEAFEDFINETSEEGNQHGRDTQERN